MTNDPIEGNDAATPAALPAVIAMPSTNEWELLERQVDQLSRSSLLPFALRGKPADIMLVVLTGRELQIPPMMAMGKVHVIDGKASLSSELMMALVLRAGHDIKVVEQTAEVATVACRRRGDRGEPAHFSFSWEDAMRAGLPDSKRKRPKGGGSPIPNSGVWYEYPKAMLTARAISMACRATFPDVLMGASYVPEELGADVDPLTGEVTGITVDVIGEGEARDLYERIDALPDALRGQLAEQMREQGIVLGRRSRSGEVVALLPKNRSQHLDDLIAGLEQWTRRASPDVVVDEHDVAEGEVVVAEPDVEEPAIPDAEVVITDHDTQAWMETVPGRCDTERSLRERADTLEVATISGETQTIEVDRARALYDDLPPSERAALLSSDETLRDAQGLTQQRSEQAEGSDDSGVLVFPADPLRAFLVERADAMTNAEVRAELQRNGWASPRAVEKLRPALVGFALAQAMTDAEQ